jgi:predicted nuclease of restriction endonuclease-like (RecB) superfamily
MDSALYQRKGKALTNFDLTLPKPQSDLATEIFKNPYNLEFLNIGSESNERDVENALIENIKKFLLELGTGFSFIAQQYNLKVGEKEFRIDLLFYHTRLHCYVGVELKVTDFIPEFAGKL